MALTTGLVLLLVSVALADDDILLADQFTYGSLAYWQTQHQFPDTTTGFIHVAYDAALDLFTAVSPDATSTVEYDGDTNSTPDYLVDGAFQLNITVDSNGNLSGPQAADSFKLLGDAWDWNTFDPAAINSPAPFLQGRVIAFDYQEDDGHVLFGIRISDISGDATTGGSGWYDPPPADIGIILNAGSWPIPANAFSGDGDWNDNFDNANAQGGVNGVSDLFAVPEPASVTLGALALTCLLGAGRRLRGSWMRPNRV